MSVTSTPLAVGGGLTAIAAVAGLLVAAGGSDLAGACNGTAVGVPCASAATLEASTVGDGALGGVEPGLNTPMPTRKMPAIASSIWRGSEPITGILVPTASSPPPTMAAMTHKAPMVSRLMLTCAA